MRRRTTPGTRDHNRDRTAESADTQPTKSAKGAARSEPKSTTERVARSATDPATKPVAKPAARRATTKSAKETARTATGPPEQTNKPEKTVAKKTANRTSHRTGTIKIQIDSHGIYSESIDTTDNGNSGTRLTSISDMQGAGADAIREYLRDIGKVKLLNGDLEVALARQIEAGREAASKLGISLEGEQEEGIDGIRNSDTTKDQVEELLKDIKLGNQAKDALIEANLRLVVSIAKRYRNRGMAFLDLIQEGNLGLMRAVEKFDYRKGFKFSTYATWWIRQSIIRALADQSRTIRIPVHVVEEMNRVLRTQRQWLQDKGREPTLEELSAKLFMHPERIKEMLRMNQDTLSLEQPIGDQEISLSDIIEDKRNEDPNDSATRTMLHDAVAEALKTLPERDRRVMELRFGLTDDGRRHTLEEVAKACMVTRERIRQIEIKTLAKLRKPDAAHALREFLDGS